MSFSSAPDIPGLGRSKSYTMDAGSATLALQVNDAVTGTLLDAARAKLIAASTLRMSKAQNDMDSPIVLRSHYCLRSK
jgi:hypothetical protein